MSNLTLVTNEPNSIVNVEQLTGEIIMLKRQTAMNIIEIGRRLIKVKQQLAHGQWGIWLRDTVEFSQQTANRFMQVASEFENSSAVLNLNPTKVYSLLELPADQREEFAAAEHTLPSGEVKTVVDMTTRELQQVIREKKRLEKELADATSLAFTADQALKVTKNTVEMLQSKLDLERQQAKEQISQLTDDLKQAKKDGASAEIIEKLQAELKEAQEQVKRLQDEANRPVILEPTVIEKVPEEIERELVELRARTKELEAGQSRDAETRYRIHFETLVTGFKEISSALLDIAQANPADYDRYKKALSVLITKMLEQF